MQTYWWPSVDSDVRHFVSTCDFCQKNNLKASNEKPTGLLQPLEIPEFCWQSVSMDFITDLPKTQAGHTAILVFVDRLSKMVHFAPCWNDVGAQEFAQIFLRDIFSKHGLPLEIVSDRGTQFTSKFWKIVAKMLGVKQCLSSSRRPQSDGQTERTNRTLKDMLRHFVSPSQDDWDLRLPCCEFAINNAWNQSTGSTPFFLNSGEHPRSPINVDVVCKLPVADAFVGRIKNAVSRARDSLLYAQQRMQKNYNAKHRAESFEVGEFAYLSPKGLLLSTVGSKKLSSRWLGPFEITERVGRLAYKLCLPASMSRVHPVFHVSLLKRPKDGGRHSAPPPAMLLEGFEECEIDKVLAHTNKPHKRQPNHREYLVAWKGMGPEDREWLSENKLRNAADLVQDYLQGLQALVAVRHELAKQALMYQQGSTPQPKQGSAPQPKQGSAPQFNLAQRLLSRRSQAGQLRPNSQKWQSLASKRDIQLACARHTEASGAQMLFCISASEKLCSKLAAQPIDSSCTLIDR